MQVTAIDNKHAQQSKYTPYLVEIKRSKAHKFLAKDSGETEWTVLASPIHMRQHVKEMQVTAMFRPEMQKFCIDQVFHLSSAEEVNKVPRYSVTVVDHYDEAVIA